ncbi:hypothetical protein B0H17DRAFT_946968 [Mycena rosella]|uniref:Uncharacterized protein n=1 Tax=Mycena rosella TaxID=1033263 RepID=A0AAD7D153_MYCRO|nr:hypothetical protein B0H17DRAFT_946968 [Mycena rosella]
MGLTAIVVGAAVFNPLATPFGINLGSMATTGNEVAWVAGTSQCMNVIVGPSDANYDSHPSNLNGQTFTVEGCGGGGIWINDADGNIYAQCGAFSEADVCGVHTTAHCI